LREPEPQPAAPAHGSALARAWNSGLALIATATLARLAYLLWICPYTLIEDEAHYWEWSRRLELSYYSKGPGVAWVIRAATEVFGTHEWSVRLPAVLFGALGAWCAAGLARDVSPHPRAGLIAAAIYLCMPAFLVLGAMMTIDGPYLACWAGACWAGWRALRRGSPISWAALGLAIAAGFLFKYTILLLVPGLAAAAWLGRRDRATARPAAIRGALIAAACAAIGLVPVILWNSRHDWVTVRHLLGHLGAPGGDVASERTGDWSPLWAPELLAMQAALAGPAILLAIFAAQHAWRERRDKPEPWSAARYLLWCGLPVLLFYILVSLVAEPEGNWPLAAWVTAAPLGALGVGAALPEHRRRVNAWRAESSRGIRPRMGRIVAWRATYVIGILVAVGAARADWAAKLPLIGKYVPLGRLMYADVRARHAERILAGLRTDTGLEPFVVAQHYGRASQLAYYLSGRPVVFSASAHTGGRTTQYDVWPETDLAHPATLASLQGRPALLVGGEPHHWTPAFERLEEAGQLQGEHKKGRRIYLAYGFRGFGPEQPAAGEPTP
jgi:4-amino-4-deoxy-L-arabinose transferase-like glycosyltransferase